MLASRRFLAMLLLCCCAAAISAAVAGRQQRYHSSGDSIDSAENGEHAEEQHQHHRHQHHQQQSYQSQQQQLVSRYVLNLNDTETDKLLSGFNVTRSELLNRSQMHRINNTTQRPGTELEQQKIDEIKEDLMHKIGRNVSQSPTVVINRADSEATVSNVAFYPTCSHHDDTAGIGPNTARVYFPLVLLSRLTPRTRLDMATLRIYQIPNARNLPVPVSCSEPNDRVFFTVSVLVKHGSGKDTHYTKRNCDTIARNVNNSTWIDLDVIEVLRQWQKPHRQSATSGMSNRAATSELMLLIDVHDQERHELNATQYFEPMDCQAYQLPIPWALYEQSAINISELDLPHLPRLDLTTRVATHRSARDHHSYDDRFNRLNQLRQAGNHHQQQQHVDLYDGLDMPDAVLTRRNSGRHHTLRQRAHHQRQLRQRSTGVRATLSTVSPASQDKMVM